MPLRRSKGNMYPWCSHTWNPIFGRCRHQCGYCYMRQEALPPLEMRDKELKITLGNGRIIFVGSATDMFAHNVPGHWINKVLYRCKLSPGNTYLFQSKNPGRFHTNEFPPHTIFGTTIETNRRYEHSAAPSVHQRAAAMAHMEGTRRTVTIEPIMDFDLLELVKLVYTCDPEFISIGADSKGHHLPEPSWAKVQELIVRLEVFTEIIIKHNLERLRK